MPVGPLPQRVRSALEPVVALLARDLGPVIERGLDALETRLSASASQSSGDMRGDVNLGHLTALRQRRDGLVPGYTAAIRAVLEGIRSGSLQIRAGVPLPGRLPSSQWTLADAPEQDVQVAEYANQMLGGAKLGLYLLGQRFGVMAGQPAVSADLLPIGPDRLVEQIGKTGTDVLGAKFPVWLLTESVAPFLVEAYPVFVDHANQLLDAEGVLPGLRYVPARKPPVVQGGPKPAAPPAAPPVEPAAPPAWLDQPAAPGSAGAFASPNFQRLQQLLAVGRSGSAGGGAAVGGGRAGDSADGGGTPRIGGGGAGGTAGSPGGWSLASQDDAIAPIRRETLNRLLDRLQGSVASGTAPATLEGIRDQLIAHARESDGEQAELSTMDADTFELLSMLYGAISREVRAGSPVVDLLGRLQLPMLRAALGDPGFFEQPTHPARQVLNTIAEADASGDDDGIDPFFEQAMQDAVKRLVDDYHGETQVLDAVNNELQAELRQQAERGEAAERRQIDGARGRERLALARRTTREFLERMLADVPPPRSMDLLLRTAWRDALTFVMLRSGADSDAWARHAAITRRILDTVSANGDHEDAELRDLVAAAMRKVGYHPSEAMGVARQLSRNQGAARAQDEISPTELVTQIKSRARFGEDAGAEGAGETDEAPPVRRTAFEEECYRQLQATPYGTWLDMVVNQQGETRRRRLSWFSRVTDMALLVNRRGQRVADMSMDRMARLMAAGQLHIVQRQDMRLIDRAWRATLSMLESLGTRNRGGAS